MSGQAHVMLRYHAPLETFDCHVKRLGVICRRLRIREVIFMIDPEEYYTGFPTLSRIREWVQAIRGAREVLDRIGVLASINPWVTLGHGGRMFGPPKSLKIQAMMVGDNGEVSTDTACPADQRWQAYIAKAYSLFALAEPNILWLEDDFRLHNHGNVAFGCFAEPMLLEFEKRTGKRWSRAELVDALVVDGEGVRSDWLQFTGDLWIEIATRIKNAVREANPNVKLAQMTSTMGAHAVEGRRWQNYLAALCSPHAPITRPHFGPYRESSGFEFVEGLIAFRNSLAFAGRSTRFCPEMENWPFSYYSKSRRQSKLQLELAQFFGCPDVTVDYFSMTGNAPENEPWVEAQLSEARPRMDALARCGLRNRIECGVHLWTSEDAALTQQVDARAKGMLSLRPSFDGWAKVLARLGVPATFETKGEITAVCGDTIRRAEKPEIMRLLAGGLLLDGRAARALQDMGYGRFLGVKTLKRKTLDSQHPYSMERIALKDFGIPGSPVMGIGQMGENWGDSAFYPMKLDGADPISYLERPDRKSPLPCAVRYHNSLGGRIAVFAYDFDSGIPESVRFYNHPRKWQILRSLRWLYRKNSFPHFPGAALLNVEQCLAGKFEYMAITNLGGDPVNNIEIRGWKISEGVSSLDENGRWRSLEVQTRGRFRFSSLEPFNVLFLRRSTPNHQ